MIVSVAETEIALSGRENERCHLYREKQSGRFLGPSFYRSRHSAIWSAFGGNVCFRPKADTGQLREDVYLNPDTLRYLSMTSKIFERY